VELLNPFACVTEKEQIKEYSKQALENIHSYANFRVNQLTARLDNLKYLCETEILELADMFDISNRIENTARNRKRFKKLKEDIEYELLRRSFDEK